MMNSYKLDSTLNIFYPSFGDYEEDYLDISNGYKKGKVTLEEWANSYIDIYIYKKYDPEKYDLYKRHISRSLLYLKAKYLEDLTPKNIKDLTLKLMENYSHSYTLMNISVLKNVLQMAVINKLIPHNPATGIKVPRARKEEFHPLSDEEMIALIRHAKQSKYFIIILTLLLTGLRIGECLGLLWGSIDFKKERILVYTQKSRDSKSIINRTKTGVVRYIYPPQILFKLLKEHKENLGIEFVSNDDPVFRRNNISLYTSASVEYEVKRLGRLIGRLELKPHQLRHQNASIIEEVTGDIYLVKVNLGHKDIKTTINYTHIRDSRSKEVAEKVNEYYINKLKIHI